LVDPERLVLVRAFDRHAKLRAQRVGGGAVVDVTVREQDLFDARALASGGGQDALDVAARVGDGGAAILADQQRAVLFKRRNGDDDDFHVVFCAHGRGAGIRRLYRRRPAPALGWRAALLQRKENITKLMQDAYEIGVN
jgi:hypothetical protein